MKRTPIRRVSKKRAAELREYYPLRKAYLEAHPYCQIWLAKHGVSEKDVVGGVALVNVCNPGRFNVCIWRHVQVPLATDIHHTNGRNGWRLNRVEWWLSACRVEHEWVKANQSEARKIGVLK